MGADIHDIAITDVWAFPPVISIWGFASGDVHVQNLGNISETFLVTAYVTKNSDNSTFTVDSAIIQDLPPGQTEYLPFTWVPFILPTIALFPPPWPWPPEEPLAENFTVWAKADVPNDSNLSNNIYVNGNVTVVWWVIDVDPPYGYIDIRDVAAVAQAFGSNLGHPRWNPYVDFNSDEKIDIRDIAASAKHFGQHY